MLFPLYPTGCSFKSIGDSLGEQWVPESSCVSVDGLTPRVNVSPSHLHKFPLWGRINYFNGGLSGVRERMAQAY